MLIKCLSADTRLITGLRGWEDAATASDHNLSLAVCHCVRGHLQELSKPARRPRRFLGEAAGRVGMSRLNGRDPHGSSCERQLGRVGVSCLNWRDPHGGSWGGGWERWVSVCLCTWVASLLFLLVRPPCPGQPQGRGAEASPLMYLRVLVPVGHVSPSPAPTPAVRPREPPADPSQGLSLWPV